MKAFFSRSSSLSLPLRIGFGYIVVVAAVLLMMVLNVTAFQVARHETAQVHDNYIPSLDAGKQLLVRLERMENAEFMYFVPGQATSQWMKVFDQSAHEFELALLRAEPMVQSDEERQFYLGVSHHFGAFVHIDRRMRALMAEGRVEQARLLNATESLAEAAELRRNAQSLYHYNLKESDRARATEAEILNVTMALTLATGLLGIAFAAWWGRRAAQEIAAPLRALQLASSQMASGRQAESHHPAAARTVEVAALQEDFNHMATSLWSASERLKAANATLEAQVEMRTQALRDANERLEHLVTELQALDQLKSNFMAVMSHELLTPINFITGFGSALEDEVMGPLSPPQAEAIRAMLEGAERLTRMVRNTLDFTQLESHKLPVHPEWVDSCELLALISEQRHPEMAARHQRFVLELPDALPPMWADPYRVEQLLMELLDNAIKFAGDGQRIRLSAHATEGAIVLDLADTGPGIPAEAMSHLFKPFFQVDGSTTRRHGGMGLGLAIAQGLAREMGGDLTVSSRLGQGSTFRVTLPRADDRPSAQDAALTVAWSS